MRNDLNTCDVLFIKRNLRKMVENGNKQPKNVNIGERQ